MASLGSEGESYQSVDFEDAESGEESDELPDLLPETFQIEQKECWTRISFHTSALIISSK